MPNGLISQHRRSIRLNGYDYSSPGAYFVTVVTWHRASLFGEVLDGEMRVNSIGTIAKEEWFRTINLRPSVHLFPDEMVVMPNHIHGIIWIVEPDMEVRAQRRCALTNQMTTHQMWPHIRWEQSCGRINPP